MCGRYVLGPVSWADYHSFLSILPVGPRAEAVAPFKTSYNIAPTQMMPVLTLADEGLAAVEARWGLIPPWYRGEVKVFRKTTFNARIETAHEKPTFRAAWAGTGPGGRCLIPASGYYEWTGEKGAKQPWFIHLTGNAPFFCFAGLWEQRVDGLVSYTILTRAADPVLSHLHHRMPVILPADAWPDWLAGAEGAWIETAGTGSGAQFGFHKTGPIRGDAPGLIDPLEEVPNAPDLFS
ncbi:MAG: SOS response-associated peptidase [Pseudomonadota bacterium]